MKQAITLLTIVLALVGLMDATYLTYEKLSGQLPVCGSGFDCGTVLSSQYAQVGPVPVSALGVLYYATVLVVASAWLLELRSPLPLTWSAQLLVLSSMGLGVSILLVGIMAFVLESWCFYCLISAAVSTSLFVVHSIFQLTQLLSTRKAA